MPYNVLRAWGGLPGLWCHLWCHWWCHSISSVTICDVIGDVILSPAWPGLWCHWWCHSISSCSMSLCGQTNQSGWVCGDETTNQKGTLHASQLTSCHSLTDREAGTRAHHTSLDKPAGCPSTPQCKQTLCLSRFKKRWSLALGLCSMKCRFQHVFTQLV